MKDFKEYLKEEEHIAEMANINPRHHKFGIDVTLNILQPTSKLSHGPRMKIMKRSSELFVITIPKTGEPKIIGDTSELKSKEVKTLIDIVKHYREVWLRLWYTTWMDSQSAVEFIEAINTNDHKKIEELRTEFPNIK